MTNDKSVILLFIENKRFNGGNMNELKMSYYYGTKAREIYDECCKTLGFDKSLSGKFAAQKRLFAEKATVENYSVWFLPNSNLNGKVANSQKWKNKVEGNLIIETWNTTLEWSNNEALRVTFIKRKDGYYFDGVYALKSADPNTKTRIFERISQTYPFENN